MSKRINILASSPTFYPVIGGAERTIYELYRRLPKYKTKEQEKKKELLFRQEKEAHR